MKLRKYLIGSIQAAVLIGLLIAAAVYSQAPSEEEVLENAGYVAGDPAASTLPRVRVIRPRGQQVTVTIETTGTITTRSVVKLVPQVGGRVTWVANALRAGGSFEADEKLLQIDPRDFEIGLAQARANLASALAELRLQRAESETATANWNLLNPNEAAPALVAKIPQMRITQARIDGARANVSAAELNMSRTAFSLPFAGRIIASDAAIGQVIAPNQSVGTAYNLNALEASITLSYMELKSLEPVIDRRVDVRHEDATYSTKIDRHSADLDPRSRVATVYAPLAVDIDLPPGLFLQATLFGPTIRDAFVLPENAEQAQGALFAVIDGSLVVHKPSIRGRVQTGLVVDSFNFGQGIVVGPVPKGEHGMRVVVVDDAS